MFFMVSGTASCSSLIADVGFGHALLDSRKDIHVSEKLI
jgi:hypothetical protein